MLESWQWVLHPVKERVIAGRGVLQPAERDTLAAMRDAVLSRVELTDVLLTDPELAAGRPVGDEQRAAMTLRYRDGLDHYRAMRTAMRRDLHIDADD